MHIIQDQARLMKRFFIGFLLNTELISYFIIIPLLFLYFYINLDISENNLMLLIKILLVVIPVSMSTTLAFDYLEIRPILKYFKKVLSGEECADEDYLKAQKRFFKLPFIHAAGSLVRWIFGLLMAYIPFVMMSNLTSVQILNVWTTAVVIPPFGMLLYFYLTERIVQKHLNSGIFTEKTGKDIALKFNFVPRMIVSLIVMLSIPLIAVAGYFLLQLERANVQWSISYVKFGLIIFFGVIISSSLIYFLTTSLKEKVSMIVEYLRKMGEGDLSVNHDILAVHDDLAMISQNVHIMRDKIADIIREIQITAVELKGSANDTADVTEMFSLDTQNQAATIEEVTATTEEISASMDSITRSARLQMASLESLVTKMDDLTETVRIMGQEISNTLSLTKDMALQAKSGEESLVLMKNSMSRIGERSSQMTNIISIINDISDKINLLSLNASIEAARAGDAGRGFSVVADEISKLADTTASSVKEIGGLIKASEHEIESGIGIVNDVVSRISAIVNGVEKIYTMADGISKFMERQIEANQVLNTEVSGVRSQSETIELSISEQKNALGEVVSSVNGINELTIKISSGSEMIMENTKKNYNMAISLKSKVDVFTLK